MEERVGGKNALKPRFAFSSLLYAAIFRFSLGGVSIKGGEDFGHGGNGEEK